RQQSNRRHRDARRAWACLSLESLQVSPVRRTIVLVACVIIPGLMRLQDLGGSLEATIVIIDALFIAPRGGPTICSALVGRDHFRTGWINANRPRRGKWGRSCGRRLP